MPDHDDSWTYKHDLALILVALAYGTDHQLSDGELETITETLDEWEQLGDAPAREVALEALVVYGEGHAAVTDVIESMRALCAVLDQEARVEVLEQVVALAEADGLLLNSERSLIATLADVWELKAQAHGLIEESSVDEEEKPDWSLLHDIALVSVVLAHSTDGDLSDPEIAAILERLNEWQPELEQEEVRRVLREALSFYSDEPAQQALYDSVAAIKEIMPVVQRLSILDDLSYIAEADGIVNEHEEEMLQSLAKAWDIHIRLNEKRPAAE